MGTARLLQYIRRGDWVQLINESEAKLLYTKCTCRSFPVAPGCGPGSWCRDTGRITAPVPDSLAQVAAQFLAQILARLLAWLGFWPSHWLGFWPGSVSGPVIGSGL